MGFAAYQFAQIRPTELIGYWKGKVAYKGYYECIEFLYSDFFTAYWTKELL